MRQSSLLPRLAPLLAVSLLAACGGGGTTGPTASPTDAGTAASSPTAGGPPHVMVIVLENQEYSDVVGSSSAPYFNQLADQYGLATNSYARTHPSLPNYIDLIA